MIPAGFTDAAAARLGAPIGTPAGGPTSRAIAAITAFQRAIPEGAGPPLLHRINSDNLVCHSR
jgi:hypothetical protein